MNLNRDFVTARILNNNSNLYSYSNKDAKYFIIYVTVKRS